MHHTKTTAHAMKILTKEEEQAHYDATLKGGLLGGVVGLGVGLGGVYAATVRYPAFRSLTIPLRAFLITSAGTFGAIISADRYSRKFEQGRTGEQSYLDETERARRAVEASKSTTERMMDWGRENRYSIVGGSWVASMGIALALVGRDPYLSGAQKLVQARVYAQGLTVAVLIATAAFEISDQRKGHGRYETRKVLDPNDPTHKRLIEQEVHKESYAGEDQWKDMLEAEERRLKEREEHVHEREHKQAKAGKKKAEEPVKEGQHKTEGAPRPKSLP